MKVKVLEIDQRGKVRLSMRVVDQETGAELEDSRPARAPREGGERGDRGDRGPRGDRGGRDRGERGEGGGRRREGRGPRRERESEDGPTPEFAPAFLTGDRD